MPKLSKELFDKTILERKSEHFIKVEGTNIYYRKLGEPIIDIKAADHHVLLDESVELAEAIISISEIW